jgi:hypothetical protein
MIVDPSGPFAVVAEPHGGDVALAVDPLLDDVDGEFFCTSIVGVLGVCGAVRALHVASPWSGACQSDAARSKSADDVLFHAIKCPLAQNRETP